MSKSQKGWRVQMFASDKHSCQPELSHALFYVTFCSNDWRPSFVSWSHEKRSRWEQGNKARASSSLARAPTAAPPALNTAHAGRSGHKHQRVTFNRPLCTTYPGCSQKTMFLLKSRLELTYLQSDGIYTVQKHGS